MVNQDQQDIEKQQEPSKAEVAAYIAATLGETEEGPRKNIERIVRAVGRTHAKELLSMTLQTEENGGLMLSDGSRRRTPGGVFFYLAYSVGKAKNGKPLQRPWNNAKPTKKPNVEASTATKTAQPSKPQNRILTLPMAKARGVLPSTTRLTTSPFGGSSRGQVSRSVLQVLLAGSRMPYGTVESFL